MELFLLLAAIWVFSTIIHFRLLAKRQGKTRRVSNAAIQSFSSAISTVYYGIFVVIIIGLLAFSINSKSYAILFISVLPIVLVLVMIFWGFNKSATYVDQLSIILLFLVLSMVSALFGMVWFFNNTP